ncbi:MAG: FliA/WhiG family RNA polymerase sigma factor [Firmicutes bacterium]|nr:FliA/WhiG family RNA polymerase sigma factor [Bacillota bacterium]
MRRPAAESLWQAYWSGDAIARSALIEHYLPLVKRICGRMNLHLPAYVDRDDLESAAVLGLMDAMVSYCPDRGVKFEAYAVTRIRGAIIDSLRRLDFVPRSVRQKAKRLQEVTEGLYAKLGRFAEDVEIATELGLSLAELHKWLQEVQAITVLSLNTPLDKDEGIEMGNLLAGSSEDDPAVRLLQTEKVNELAQAISGLNEREQLLLSLYYDEELTLKEAAQVLGISESRASQIHSAALLKLRAKLKG